MKTRNVCSMVLLALVVGLLAVSCGSKKSVTGSGVNLSEVSDAAYLRGVVANAPDFDEFSAKMRLTASYGGENISVGGSIKMKKDEVIQLSLVAIGIVEAARIEITPKRLLLLDRIGRRYMEVDYDELKFFADSKIDFYTLQALFWNELFLPGVKHVEGNDIFRLNVNRGEAQVTLTSQASKRLCYSFLTALESGRLEESQVHVTAKKGAGYQMNWSYTDFLPLGGQQFPSKMNLSLDGTEKPMKAAFSFSRWNTQVEYEPLSVPARYKRVEAADILKVLLAL